MFTILNKKSLRKNFISLLCIGTILFSFGTTALAAKQKADPAAERLERNRALPVASNEVPDWPEGPIVGAASAILMDAETGTVLYSKNIHDRHYPASTTKILTTLIATEECHLDEEVSFSREAVFGIPRGSNNIAIDAGEVLPMDKCLEAILIRSANEVAYAVAEHISGSFDDFAALMNSRATELGCVDSHFVNPNGLPDENHYTSAYDLAKIGQAFFANDLLCRITLTPTLRVTKKNGELVDHNKMELLPGKKYGYEYLVGCKTGYTDDARYTLVSCAEKNGLKLICVVMEDEYPAEYEDTISLFNYGFSNFDKVNVSVMETKYDIDNRGLFYGENDMFGNSSPVLSVDRQSMIIVPKTVAFADLTSVIDYSVGGNENVAKINYSYHGIPLGNAYIRNAKQLSRGYSFESDDSELTAVKTEDSHKKPAFLFINIPTVLTVTGIVIVLIVLSILFYKANKKYHFKVPFKERLVWKWHNRRIHKNRIREARKHSRQNYRYHKEKMKEQRKRRRRR